MHDTVFSALFFMPFALNPDSYRDNRGELGKGTEAA